MTSLRVQGEERHRINLGGTRVVFEHCRTYGVKHALFVGRHTFYGAAPDSPLYHTEDEPPKELATFPELADLVAACLDPSPELRPTVDELLHAWLPRVERLTVDGVEYEAFNTSGGVATMAETFAGRVQELNYKTLRYPGHRDLMKFLLVDLNLAPRQELVTQIFDQEVPPAPLTMAV